MDSYGFPPWLKWVGLALAILLLVLAGAIGFGIATAILAR